MAEAARLAPHTQAIAATDGAADFFSPAGPLRSRWDRVPSCLLLLLCMGLLVLFRLRAEDPLGVRPDSWSEANVIVSARNVSANGAWKYHGVAQHQVDHPPFKNDPFYYYAHYPLGASYINWVLYGLGTTTWPSLRWPPSLCALATLILWYALLCRFLGRWTALLSTVVLGTSFGFLAYADNIFQGYSSVLLVAMMLCYVAAVASSGRRRLFLMAGSWVFLFINSFMSWEWYLWSQVFYWGHALLLGVPFKKRWLLAFAVAPMLAFGIHQTQRAAAFNEPSGGSTIQDALRRTIRLRETADTPPDVTLETYPEHVAKRFTQLYGIDISALWLVTLVCGIALGGLDPFNPRPGAAFRWIALLFLCGVSWWCVMLQHTAVHPHVMRHAVFFYALALGVGIAGALHFTCGFGYSPWVRLVSGAILLTLIWPHAAGFYSNIKMHSDRSYVPATPWDAGWSEQDQFMELANKLPADAIILTNNNRLPLLRYWTRLPVYPATFARYPYNRDQPLPNARLQLELTTSHLRDLYGAQLPRVLYVYFFQRDPNQAYAGDPVLWQLIHGSWTKPDTYGQFINFQQVLTQGTGSTRYPIVARGSSWLAFDAGSLLDNLPPESQHMPPPTRADFGPPR